MPETRLAPLASPFEDRDGDKLREECGLFGVIGLTDAANFVALGLHALQHRGQEAGGIVTYDADSGFHSSKKLGYVRDNFTTADSMAELPGRIGIGHVRYSTAGGKGATALRDVQPFLADLAMGSMALAHNGNLTNALSIRRELIERGSVFNSSSDTEAVVHLMARGFHRTIADRMKEALRRVEGAFAIVCMTETQLIGCRDPLGVRPLVLGRLGEGWMLASETCALDIVGAEFVREILPGEMVIIDDRGVHSSAPFETQRPRFCIFEHVYFSRPDSVIGGRSVYESRRQIGVELAREAPVDADLVCAVPDSGTPAAIGYSQESGIPFAMGIIRNQYVGRTFIEPSEQIRNMGVRLKLNVNRALVRGKRVVLVDDSVVRGTTSMKIKEMILDAGAREVHFRIASPPTAWPCFYGVDTPDKDKLLASHMTEDEMCAHLGVDSLRFVSLDGLYRAVGEAEGRDPGKPQYCDDCFSGEYPIQPSDMIESGRISLKAAE